MSGWFGDPPLTFRPMWWWYTPDPSTVEVDGAELLRWDTDGGHPGE